MKNFLYKEFKLNLGLVNYLFLAFPLMLLIPNYPCYVPFFYACLSIFFIFNNSVINKDMDYSIILPISKKEIVKSRCLLILFYELIFILISIPFAIIMNLLIKIPNNAGIDANVAFYGLMLICLSAFNYTYITKYYKKIERPGLPFLLGSIFYFSLFIIFEFPVWTKNIFNISFFQLLDKTDIHSQILQLPLLAVGIIIYIFSWCLTIRKAGKIFDKVDL